MSRSLTLTRSVVVGQAALAAALLAVAPLAGKEEAARVRLVLDPGRGCLAVTATNRCDRALASTPLIEAWDCADGEVVDVDMSAETARTIARVHRPGKDDDGSLEVAVDDQEALVQVTDVTGLLPGRCLRLHLTPPGERVDVGGALARAAAEPLAAVASLRLSARTVKAWTATATVLGGLPVRATSEGHLLVVCDSPEDDRLHGLELLGCTETSGISQAATAAPRAYDGPLVGLCEALEVNQPEPRDGGDEIRRRFEDLARDLASAQGVRGLHLVVPGGDPA